MKFVIVICFLLHHVFGAEDRYLSLPQKELCDKRFMEGKFEGKNFLFSGHDPELKDMRLDWLDARNECRKRCMETISFQTQKKFDFYKDFITKHNISFVWTSGRICDFAGCEGRWDLLPKIIKGWLWSADQTQIDETDKIPKNWDYQPWSKTGFIKKPQPDNAEYFISQTRESCLAILNNQYNDSVAWHDIACYHRARFICEDSEALLEEAIEIANRPKEELTTTSRTTKATKPSTTKKAKDITIKEITKSIPLSSTQKVTTTTTTTKKPIIDSDEAASQNDETTDGTIITEELTTITEAPSPSTSKPIVSRVIIPRRRVSPSSPQKSQISPIIENSISEPSTIKPSSRVFQPRRKLTSSKIVENEVTTSNAQLFRSRSDGDGIPSRASNQQRRRRTRTTTVTSIETSTTSSSTTTQQIPSTEKDADSLLDSTEQPVIITDSDIIEIDQTTLPEEIITSTTTSASPQKSTRFPLRRRKQRPTVI